MPKKYRIIYELGGEVSAYVLQATSKYNAIRKSMAKIYARQRKAVWRNENQQTMA